MDIELKCTKCKKRFKLGKYRYNERIKKNSNYKPHCSISCAFPKYTDNVNKKHCAKCDKIKYKTEFNKDVRRKDKLTAYCIPCRKQQWLECIKRNPNLSSQVHKKRRWNRKIQLFNVLGQSICKFCGFSIWQALQFEHKNGKGAYDKIRFKNLDQFYKHYIENPLEAKNELQICCANCNWIKRFKNNEHR